MYISEDRIRGIIRGVINELNLYHGSKSSFDKFNHKKYLSSGAGSQTFGWGTYLTDSYEIARSYVDAFLRDSFKEFVENANPDDYLPNGSYDEDLISQVNELYSHISKLITSALNKGDINDKNIMDIIDHRMGSIPSELSFIKHPSYQDFLAKGKKNGFPSCPTRIGKPYDLNDKIVNGDWRSQLGNLLRQVMLNVCSTAKNEAKRVCYIYEVQTPDDNGSNYLDYSEPVSNDVIKRVSIGLQRINGRFGVSSDVLNKFNILIRNFSEGGISGSRLMDIIGVALSSGGKSQVKQESKMVSLFLMQCGFVGIKYKAGTLWGLPDGAKQGSMNYVIFDANNIKITSKNLFELNDNGPDN